MLTKACTFLQYKQAHKSSTIWTGFLYTWKLMTGGLGNISLGAKKKLFKIKSCSQIQIFLKIVNEIKNISWEANSWNDLFSFKERIIHIGRKKNGGSRHGLIFLPEG